MKLFLKLFFLLTVNILFCNQQEYEVHNMSINSKYAELGATYTETNKLVFASSKKLITDKPFIKNRRKHNRELYLELFEGSIDKNGNIIKAKRISNEIFNKFHEFDFGFTPDLKRIYFTSIKYDADKSKKTLHIFLANFNKNFNLSNITPLRYNSKSYSLKNPRISKDGKHLLVSSNMEKGFGEYDLYILDILDNGSHSTPRNLGPNINTKKSELFPFIDEHNTLYFSSYGHDSDDSLNIYKSESIDGVYQKPEKLPYPINSHSDDFGFVINSADNRGYFTSNRESGKGDVDIYAFKPKPKECFQFLSGLLSNANSSKLLNHIEITLNLTNNKPERKIFSKSYKYKLKCNEPYKMILHKKGFETIEHPLQTSSQNGYTLKHDYKLTPLTCNQQITGSVTNKKTGQSLGDVLVNLYHNLQLVESQLIRKDSSFNFEAKCSNTYRIIAKKEKFTNEIMNFKTGSNNNFQQTKILNLQPINCKQIVSGSVLDKDTENPLTYSKIKIFKNNKLIDSLLTDVNGKYNYEIDCNNTYRLSVSLKNYNNDVAIIKTSNSINKNITKNFHLESNIEFVILREQKMVNVKPINFDLNESSMRNDSRTELDKIVNILMKYPTIKLEINSHTDSRAPDKLNLNLSNNRVKSIINYIISKGVNSDRITGKGYGETLLLNKCSNGVKCSEDEHQLNRRTEFIVIGE